MSKIKMPTDKFHRESTLHRLNVATILMMVIAVFDQKAKFHDMDKMTFEGTLDEWVKYFKEGKHFLGNNNNTHHHKEDIQTLLDAVEMIADWIAAGSEGRSTGKREVTEDSFNSLPWAKLAYNTYVRLSEASKNDMLQFKLAEPGSENDKFWDDLELRANEYQAQKLGEEVSDDNPPKDA